MNEKMSNRWWIIAICSLTLTTLLCVIATRTKGATELVVHVTAKKFEFSPAEITLKKGEPLILEIQAEDVKHGFSLVDFKVRQDLKPGAVTRVRLTPDKAGKFTFACDVFCGSGHEDMSGVLTVTE